MIKRNVSNTLYTTLFLIHPLLLAEIYRKSLNCVGLVAYLMNLIHNSVVLINFKQLEGVSYKECVASTPE